MHEYYTCADFFFLAKFTLGLCILFSLAVALILKVHQHVLIFQNIHAQFLPSSYCYLFVMSLLKVCSISPHICSVVDIHNVYTVFMIGYSDFFFKYTNISKSCMHFYFKMLWLVKNLTNKC